MPSSVSDGSRPPSSCLIFSYSCGVMPCSRISSGVIEEFAVETMADFRLPIVSISDQSRAKDASIKMEICPPGFGILFSHFPPRLGRVCAFSSQGLIFRYSECPYDGGNPQRSQTTRRPNLVSSGRYGNRRGSGLPEVSFSPLLQYSIRLFTRRIRLHHLWESSGVGLRGSTSDDSVPEPPLSLCLWRFAAQCATDSGDCRLR